MMELQHKMDQAGAEQKEQYKKSGVREGHTNNKAEGHRERICVRNNDVKGRGERQIV